MTIKVEYLRGDDRTREARIWNDWMTQAAFLSDRYYSGGWEDDPFAYNEAASVSHLAAAAALAGFVGLAEWSTRKRNRLDGRKIGHGRSDLWLRAEKYTWSFEFKQIRGSSVGPKRLCSAHSDAISNAKQIHSTDANSAVASVIISLAWWEDDERARIRDHVEEFIHGEFDRSVYAWKIVGPENVDEDIRRCETYLFFDVLRKFE